MHCLLTGRSLWDLLPAPLCEQGQLRLLDFFNLLDGGLEGLLEMCGVDEAAVSDEAVEFLGLMLRYKPPERATAKQLLEHEFLATGSEVAAGSDMGMAVAAAEAVDHAKAGSEITAAAPTAAPVGLGVGGGVLQPSAAVAPAAAAGGGGARQPQPLGPLGSLKKVPAALQRCFFTPDDGSDCQCLHLQLHAKGSHAEVYVGVPLFQAQHVIVKAAELRGVELLQNEAKVLAHLGQHANICSLLGTGQSI